MRETTDDYRSYQSYADAKPYSSNQVCHYPDPSRSGKITSSVPTSNNYSHTSSSSSSSSSWSFNDPEMKRRKRVASYKAYAVEGRVKATIRKGFRWVKNKYSELMQSY
ncbi:hypothetical protein L1049_017425 [Liquidambar formosana]|uniref:DUF3511 domain protein n=1 Tax=Liquidambar formosana TaxID=63359 RepID=A0AAP0X192_LIQFO